MQLGTFSFDLFCSEDIQGIAACCTDFVLFLKNRTSNKSVFVSKIG